VALNQTATEITEAEADKIVARIRAAADEL
jgi:hypothetical protein